MFNVRLAGGYLYGKRLFTWLSLVVSLMTSFVLSFFPLDVMDEIWDLIESVSEGFLTYFSSVITSLKKRKLVYMWGPHLCACVRVRVCVCDFFIDELILIQLDTNTCIPRTCAFRAHSFKAGVKVNILNISI